MWVSLAQAQYPGYVNVHVDSNGNIYAMTAGSEFLRSNDGGQTRAVVSQGPRAPARPMGPRFTSGIRRVQ